MKVSQIKLCKFEITIHLELDPPQYSYHHGSKHSSFNEQTLIQDDEQKDQLLKEIDRPEAELLQRAFAKHCKTLHWKGDSGKAPHMILSVNVWLDRVSPTLYFAEPDAEPELEDFEMN